MITIELSNGKKVSVEDDSSDYDFIIRTDSAKDIDYYKELFTEKNINGAIMNGEVLDNRVFNDITQFEEDGKIRIDFYFRAKTETDILLDRIASLEKTSNREAKGGDLESRVAALEEKVSKLMGVQTK